MKRARVAGPLPPSTPPTPPLHRHFIKHPKPISYTRRNILNDFPPIAAAEWKILGIDKSELSLPLTFPTGQTFRWKSTGDSQYTGAIGRHLFSLKQLENDTVRYNCHFSEDEDVARADLFDFLNMSISLNEIWSQFKAVDQRFAEISLHLEGARVLRQDPLECLIQFICSSNNNIQRITKMVDFISSKGKLLGNVGGYDFFEFPTLERLASISESELREAGFGYRAKYIVGTVEALRSKPGGGLKWLASLRQLDLQTATNSLSSLPGVGPKVAACVALFSLDHHQSVPVDTHLWQIATRDVVPELVGSRFGPRLHSYVADAFVRKYGKFAGWAQTLLFISELPSQKAILQNKFGAAEVKRIVKVGNNKSLSKKRKGGLRKQMDLGNVGLVGATEPIL